MKSFRRAIMGAGVVLILLLALGAAAPYLIDGGTIRSQLFTKMSGWAEGRLQVNGPVYLTSLFDLTIEAHDVEILEPEHFANVVSLRAERIAARLSLWDLLNRRIAFEKMWLKGLEVSLREPPDNLAAADLWRALVLNDPPVLDDILRAGEDAPFERMVVRDVRFLLAPTGGAVIAGLDGFSGVVRRAPDGSRFSVNGRAPLHGEPVEIEMSRSRFTPEGPTDTARLRVALESASLGRISADGRIVKANGVRFIGRLEIGGAPVQPIAARLDLPADPALGTARLSASGNIAASEREIALQELRIGVGTMQANGLLRIELKDRPKVSGTLGLGAVDLSGAAFAAAQTAAMPGDPGADGGAAQASLLAAALGRFDADLRLSAESILLDGVSAGPAAAFLSVTDGVAAIDLAELMVFDGAVNGQFTGRWAGGQFSISGKGRAENVELAQVLPGAGAAPLATGRADVSFTLSASAANLQALARRARLSGRLVAVDGGDLALDLAALAVQHAQRGALGQSPAGQAAITTARGEYDTMTCAFVLDGGALDVHSLEIVQDGWLIGGRGRIDLADLMLDWRFDARQMARPIEARALSMHGSALTDGSEDAIGLRLHGPVHDPRVIYRAPTAGVSGVRG